MEDDQEQIYYDYCGN